MGALARQQLTGALWPNAGQQLRSRLNFAMTVEGGGLRFATSKTKEHSRDRAGKRELKLLMAFSTIGEDVVRLMLLFSRAREEKTRRSDSYGTGGSGSSLLFVPEQLGWRSGKMLADQASLLT